MNNWLSHPLVLEDELVKLVPLAIEHFEELADASSDEIIWTYMPVRGMDKNQLLVALKDALKKREEGEQYPFVVVDKQTGRLIGSTRYLRLNEEHRNLEIGYTWYLPDYWGSGYNEACKLLLLTHCFETLKTVRVQIIASDLNVRSRRAIERLGAVFEGVLRDVVIRNGNKRSVAYYSILEEEWPTVQSTLKALKTKRLMQHAQKRNSDNSR